MDSGFDASHRPGMTARESKRISARDSLHPPCCVALRAGSAAAPIQMQV